MATHLFDHRIERRENRLAWLASAGVHAVLVLVLGAITWHTIAGNRPQGERREEAVVVGLTDGSPTDPHASDAATAAAFDPTTESASPTDNLAAEVGLAPLPVGPPSAEPLTPAPQISALALTRAPTADSAPTTATKESGGAATGPASINKLIERATVTVFGAVGEGRRFVYLFDRSTSMEGAPLVAAKQQLIESLDALSSVHQFQVIFFNHEVQAWDMTGGQGRIPFASDANKRLAAEFVETVAASGGTDRLSPLRRALAMRPDVIFFLTDADDAMPAYDVADIVERAQGAGTAIACIEFGEGPRPEGARAKNFLTQLAGETHGDYVYVDVTRLFKR